MSISSFNIAPAMSSCFFFLPSSIPSSLPSSLPFSIPSSNPSSRPSSNPLSFAKAIWFRMSRSVVMSFRYLILSSGAKLCKSAEENNRSKISPSNPAGCRATTVVCLFFIVRANSEKLPKCALGAQLATAKQHLETGLRNTPSSHPVFPWWLLLFVSRFVLELLQRCNLLF